MEESISDKSKLDQYYTSPEVAKYFTKKVTSLLGDNALFIEPSAGVGAFVEALEGKCIKSFDLSPMLADTVEKDFLTTTQEDFDGGVHFIGNPPFGKNSSLAVKFFNHCAKYGESISFILPKTFKKIFFKERLNPYTHLVFEEDCPKNSFQLDGENYDVPCVFQVWIKKGHKREMPSVVDSPPWVVTDKENADLFIRRVGGCAGKVLDKKIDSLSSSTTYYLKMLDNDVDNKVKSVYPLLKDIASNTAGVRSISLKEIQYVLENNKNVDTGTESHYPTEMEAKASY